MSRAKRLLKENNIQSKVKINTPIYSEFDFEIQITVNLKKEFLSQAKPEDEYYDIASDLINHHVHDNIQKTLNSKQLKLFKDLEVITTVERLDYKINNKQVDFDKHTYEEVANLLEKVDIEALVKFEYELTYTRLNEYEHSLSILLDEMVSDYYE